MELRAITRNNVIFTTAGGKIISEPLAQDAKQVLRWYAENIPANDK